MAGFCNNPSPLSPSLSVNASDVLHSVRKGGWEEFISTETLTEETEQSSVLIRFTQGTVTSLGWLHSFMDFKARSDFFIIYCRLYFIVHYILSEKRHGRRRGLVYHGQGASDAPIMGGYSKERIDRMATSEAAEIMTKLQGQRQSAQGTNILAVK